MTQVSNSFEGGTNGVTVSTANSGGASGNAFDATTVTTPGAGNSRTFDNAQKAHDTLSLKIVSGGTTSEANYVGWTTAIGGTMTEMYGRFYLRLSAAPSGTVRVLRVGDAATNASLIINTTPAIRWLDSANSSVGGTFTLSTGTWYRVEWRVKQSATVGEVEANIYLLDSTTVSGTISSTGANTGASAIDGTRQGLAIATTNTVTYWLDDMVSGATTWPGPYTVSGGGTPQWGGVIVTGHNELQRQTNQARSTTGTSSGYWATSFGPACEAWVTIPVKPTVSDHVGLWLRTATPATAGVDGYVFNFYGFDAATDEFRYYRCDNGVFTQLGASVLREWAAGDSIGFRASGSTLTGYHRPAGSSWSPVESRTDATYSAAGFIGIEMSGTVARVDEFGGGTISTVTLPTPSRSNLGLLGVG